MAYSGKFLSIKRIIENVHRESGYENIDIENVLEWSADLLRLVGVNSVFVDKSTNGEGDNFPFIQISNYRGYIPSDLISLISCRKVILNGESTIIGTYPMIETQDMFFGTESTNQIFGSIVTEPYFKTVQINNDGETEVVQITQENSRLTGSQTYQYKISGDVIFANFENGFVEFVYKGIALDEDGLPMIPDDVKLIKALVWEIISNLDRIKWRLNPSPQNKSILNDSQTERDFYVGAAINKGKIPNIDQMESIKNAWLRSIPKVDSYSNSFKTNNYPEVRYTHNARRWRVR